MDLIISEKMPKDGVRVLAVRGRLNAITSGELKDKLKQLVDEGVIDIVLDLSAVTFIDSSGLSAIVSGLKVTREQAGSLKIVGLNPSTKKVFELTRLDKVFELFERVEDALGE